MSEAGSSGSLRSRSDSTRLGREAGADREAFARLSRGDASAFVSLFRRYYDGLCAFAESFVTSADDAEEVVSDVFVRLWEARGRLTVRTSVKSYLYAATRNTALNHLRSRDAVDRAIRRASETGALRSLTDQPATAPSDLLTRELERVVDSAIEKLPPRRREVFLLHRYHGLTYAEIATTLDLARKTVENHIGLALRDLRDHLAPYLED